MSKVLDKLLDYTYCLEQAIDSAKKEALDYKPNETARHVVDEEIATLEIVLSDLISVTKLATNSSYWHFGE